MSGFENALTFVSTADDLSDLRKINEALTVRWKILQGRAAKAFSKGEAVTFKSTTGVMIEGVVDRVNRKTVTVQGTGKFQFHSWRVPPTLLSRI